MMLIVVSGYRGSGKTFFGNIARSLNFPVVEMSSFILEKMREEKIEINSKNIISFATRLREEKGESAVASIALPYLKELLKKEKIIIIIGVRSLAEYKVFSDLDKSELVFIDADENVRFERVKVRNRENDPKTIEEMREMDKIEGMWGLKEIKNYATKYFVNNGSKEEFENIVKNYLTSITKK